MSGVPPPSPRAKPPKGRVVAGGVGLRRIDWFALGVVTLTAVDSLLNIDSALNPNMDLGIGIGGALLLALVGILAGAAGIPIGIGALAGSKGRPRWPGILALLSPVILTFGWVLYFSVRHLDFP
jgi:hypothetical protein